jgi:hypothetical protein
MQRYRRSKTVVEKGGESVQGIWCVAAVEEDQSINWKKTF